MNLSALSPSRINTTKDCELKYFLEYHIKLPQSRESNIYGLKGSAGHESLEFYTNHIRLEQNKDTEFYDKLKEELKDKHNEDYTQVLKDYYARTELWKTDDREGMRGRVPKGWIHPYEKSCESCEWMSKDGLCEIAKKPATTVEGCPRPNFQDDLDIVEWTIKNKEYEIFKYEILGAEVEFTLDVGDGVKIRGIIDLVVRHADGKTIEIIDFKTGNSTKSYNAALTDPQMRIYAMVARMMWPEYEVFMTSLYYVRKRRMVTCIFSAEDDAKTMKTVKQHWNKISNNVDPWRPRRSFWLCNFCVGYEACGKIKNNYVKNGRFILPTIQCAHPSTKEEPCWGPMGAENPKEVTIENTHLMTYTCVGHKKLQKGGLYEKEPDGDKTIR